MVCWSDGAWLVSENAIWRRLNKDSLTELMTPKLRQADTPLSHLFTIRYLSSVICH
jgi:hypothetical protein